MALVRALLHCAGPRDFDVGFRPPGAQCQGRAVDGARNPGLAADRAESLWIAIQANARAIKEKSTVV
jgi:hypothetical protein